MRGLLEIKNLNVSFAVDDNHVHILNNVSMDINENEVLAVIGETGCGKSVTGSAILHLLPDNAIVTGNIFFKGQDITKMNDHEFRQLRGQEISSVPQSPSTSLNPLMHVGNQVAECVLEKNSSEADKKKTALKVHEIFSRLGLPRGEDFYENYPCELSGGMCQRVLIAMGVITHPELLIVDEPTKAVDWALRKDVMDVFCELKNDMKCAMLFITHDIAAAKYVADRVAVMYCGEVVEIGPTDSVINQPRHPYTKGLIASMPSKGFNVMNGFMPSFQDLPKGCRFSDRCECSSDICVNEEPESVEISAGHFTKCSIYKNMNVSEIFSHAITS
ncbi:ABC transporter ATP-binding protein [Acetobacterium sp.]|jgi:peptide/nickel transport system ATP-binding protein|uniref:ABC transporter ATP-binding protein n=1 Tax=Acetobacterium sp. TaxID=1872094 RepID=UPI000CC0A8AA|nr:ABC transporter ATP-binding protein [Acetobacterium sp.]MDO9491520.1 ABC transporter ATP-binding protein [Acetobacterium sp.]PKM74654.1 MAG: dipeptide ABC transporter ATP-binding protein DppD [Firmicutes bacterium HGW-Firmicutes-17]